MSERGRVVLLTTDELEVGVIVMELARLNGNAKPKPGRRASAAALEQKLVAALERNGRSRPTLEEIEGALDVLLRAGALGETTLEPASRMIGHARALEYYADHTTYERVGHEQLPADVQVGDPRVMIDRGAHARRALRGEASS